VTRGEGAGVAATLGVGLTTVGFAGGSVAGCSLVVGVGVDGLAEGAEVGATAAITGVVSAGCAVGTVSLAVGAAETTCDPGVVAALAVVAGPGTAFGAGL
jgi:hypothetical protein